ncbi:MAG: ABC transporter substrate-binding protein [bacterium]
MKNVLSFFSFFAVALIVCACNSNHQDTLKPLRIAYTKIDEKLVKEITKDFSKKFKVNRQLILLPSEELTQEIKRHNSQLFIGNLENTEYKNCRKKLIAKSILEKDENTRMGVQLQSSNEYNEQAVKLGYSRFKRNIYLYELDSDNKTENLVINSSSQNFIEYVQSKEAQKIVTKLKFVPLTMAEISLNEHLDQIKIGVPLPFTSVDTQLAQSVLDSIELAAANFPQRNFKLIICDDHSKIDKALECAKYFISEKVTGVIGHFNSQTTIEASKLYISHNIVQISPCSTHPWFTHQKNTNNLVFRAISIDNKQAETIANLISDLGTVHKRTSSRLRRTNDRSVLRVHEDHEDDENAEIGVRQQCHLRKTKKISTIMLINNGTLFSSNLSAQVETSIKEIYQDSKIELLHKSITSERPYQPILDKKIHPELIVFIGGYIDAANIINNLHEQNHKDIIFIGSDGTYSDILIKLTNNRSNGVYVIGANIDSESKEFLKYKEILLKKYKSKISADGIYGYDAAKILFTAIEANHKGYYKSISEAMHSIEFQSLGRKISFDKYGDPIDSTYAVYQIDQGEFKKLKHMR